MSTSTRPTALLQIGGHQLIVQIDKTLADDTIIVPSYGTLDLLTGAMQGVDEPVVREEVDRTPAVIRAALSTITQAAEARWDNDTYPVDVKPAKRRRRKARANPGGFGKPRHWRGHVTSEQAAAALAKNGVVLNDVELDILGRYYGINGHRQSSQLRIAKRYGVSQPSVGAFLHSALQKLGLPYSETRRKYVTDRLLATMRRSFTHPDLANEKVQAGKVVVHPHKEGWYLRELERKEVS